MKADAAAMLGYRARLEALGPPPYLGLAWHGGTPATHEAVRNAPLEQWKKIIDGVNDDDVNGPVPKPVVEIPP